MIQSQNLRLFLGAVGFFTRIPVPTAKVSQLDLDRFMRFFPLLGLIIGTFLGMLQSILILIFNLDISLLICLGLGILLTGALHEDGLADFADGFGGGFSKERVLEIMKDSRIGTYGAATLIIIIGLKFTALRNIPEPMIPLAFATSHCLSRATSSALTWSLHYVRNQPTFAGNVVRSSCGRLDILIQSATALGALYLIPTGAALSLLASLSIFYFVFRFWIFKRIGGYTGDCLGAAQQISEVLIYLALVSFYQ